MTLPPLPPPSPPPPLSPLWVTSYSPRTSHVRSWSTRAPAVQARSESAFPANITSLWRDHCQARSQPVSSGKPEGLFCLSCTFIFRNERNWMKKSARVTVKLVQLLQLILRDTNHAAYFTRLFLHWSRCSNLLIRLANISLVRNWFRSLFVSPIWENSYSTTETKFTKFPITLTSV